MPLPPTQVPPGRPMAPPPSPPPTSGSPAERTAGAMADVVQKQREMIDATMPKGGEPLSTKEVEAVSECAVKAIKALDGPEMPAWKAEKGMREVPSIPPDVYRMAMLILLMAAKVLPPDKAGQFTVTPEDFASDAGLKKVYGMLALIERDKKLQKLIHEGVATMMKGGGAPVEEGAEAEPNPDKGAEPHAEPDQDDYTTL